MNLKKNGVILPFRYPGGKFYALGLLRPFIAAVTHDEYREPFAGGASVYFDKSKSKNNWLNDLDSELVTTYKAMKCIKCRNKLVDELSKEVASRERWREVYESKPTNDFEIARKYYYLNRTSFSGKLSSAAWGYRPKRSLPPERWHERIVPCGEKLEDVTLTNLDFADVIDAPARGEQTMLFVDPPYFNPPKNKHYRNGFDLDDHLRLVEVLKRSKHKFCLTYDDIPEVRKLYSWANITDAKFFYRVDNSNIQQGFRRIGFELIITNYQIPEQFSLFT